MTPAAHNHPEAAERSTAPRSASHASPPAKLINAEILADLVIFQKEHGLTNRKLGQRLGYSESLMGRALAQLSGGSKTGFNGDVAKFEAAVRELFHNEEQRRRAPLDELQTHGFMVAPMRAFLDSVAHTGDIGIAYSPAGKGKTCGARVWLAQNKLAVMVTALKSRSGWRAIREAIVDALPFGTRPKKREGTAAFIQRIFHGSKRLLIIDNAHLLTESARYWLAYDWNEDTGCPVALLGNEVIVNQWGHREGVDANDQLSSRVGLAYEVKPAAEQRAEATARQSISLYYPPAGEDAEAVAVAVEILKNKGAARALKKHLLLAADLSAEATLAPAEALRRANGLLLGKKLAA